MTLEGKIHINLRTQSGRVVEATITSERAVHASDVFTGQTPASVLNTLPLVFSVCGMAQAGAAAGVFEDAIGIDLSEQQANARSALVVMETIREHLWRILLDWPTFANQKSQTRLMGQVGQLVRRFRSALYPGNDSFRLGGGKLAVNRYELDQVLEDLGQLVDRDVFGQRAEDWLKLSDAGSVCDWATTHHTTAACLVEYLILCDWASLGQTDVLGLPELPKQDLHLCLQEADAHEFIARPHWHGEVYETTAFSRQHDKSVTEAVRRKYGNGLLTRLIARLQELAHGVQELRRLTEHLQRDTGQVTNIWSTGSGLSQIEAARGRLIHRVELVKGRVKRYQIVAPTEWNFHPQGLLARALVGLEDESEHTLLRQAKILVNVIDPCVDYRIRVH